MERVDIIGSSRIRVKTAPLSTIALRPKVIGEVSFEHRNDRHSCESRNPDASKPGFRVKPGMTLSSFHAKCHANPR